MLIHLLKCCYVALPKDYRGWGNTIDEQRRELVLLLEQSPSLKRYLAAEFDEVWTYALRQVRKDYPAVEFPDDWPFSREVEALLTQEFWQN